MEEEYIALPPGFRFHPTNEEIITHYLAPKILNRSFTAVAIGEVDLNKSEPWDLPNKAKMGAGREMYFFCHRDKKYPTGMRINRATEAGYWKATGKDKEIHKGKGVLVGFKKTLVFYKGRAPKGEKTTWVMHEFRLEGKFSLPNLPKSAKDEWVVCRVLNKNAGQSKERPEVAAARGLQRIYSFGDDHLLLPDLLDHLPSSSLIDNDEVYDFKVNPSTTMTSFSTMLGMDEIEQQLFLNLQSQPFNSFSLLANPGGDLHQDEANDYGASLSSMRKQCKVEPYWSCPSQDTDLSIDHLDNSMSNNVTSTTMNGLARVMSFDDNLRCLNGLLN